MAGEERDHKTWAELAGVPGPARSPARQKALSGGKKQDKASVTQFSTKIAP